MTWFVLAVTVALTGGLVLVATGAVRVRRHRSTWRAVITTALLWVWAWGVLAMTFGTRSGGGSALNLKPLDLTNQADIVDFALNLVLFLPAGVLLAIRGAKFWMVLLVAAGGSLSIEVMQYVLETGRTADINDLAANITGCLLGFLATRGILRTASRDQAAHHDAHL